MGRKCQTLDSLLSKADKDPETGCLVWNKVRDKDGYGITSISGTKLPAHRAVMSFLTDVTGKYVLHKCDNSGCINPEHLYLGNQKDNIADQITNGTNSGVNKITAKLSASQVREIRASTLAPKELALVYNVSYHCVWDILNFRSWKNV